MINESTGRRRVLLKLSGEAFGAGSLGVNAPLMDLINSWSTAQRVPFDLGCARTRSNRSITS